MELQCISLILTCVILGCFPVSHSVEVQTDVGTIVGTIKAVTVKGTEYRVKNFLGIPYAKPPIGARRWQKPEAMEPFDKPFEASEYGNACPQNKFPGMHEYTTSEDCLTLNVQVPDQSPDKAEGHAVMVFIHGGGFNMGASDTFRFERMVSYGNVLMVTINYRLGIFGFLDSEDGRVPGNLGFHDQHLALKWVNKHVGAFGGDNTRVTIFGESAGGSSVIFQGLYPPNKGLFQRVISESGVPSARSLYVKNPKETFEVLSKEVGCTDTDTTLECLRAVDTATFMSTISDFATKHIAAQFLPTVDGEIIKIPGYDISDQSRTQQLEQVEFYRSLDVTIGFNNDEGAMFLLLPVYPFEDNVTYTIPREDFKTKAVPSILTTIYGPPIHDTLTTLVVGEYTNWEDPNLPENNRDQYIKLWGDLYFTVGSVEYTRLHANSSNKGNSYAYYFTALPVNHLLKTPDCVKGANHADELNYVMLFEPELNRMTEDLKPFADWEYELSYRMVTYWTNFAKSGNPNEPVQLSPSINWPQYDLTDQKYINFNKDMTEDSIQTHLFDRETNFWLKTVPEVMDIVSHDHDSSSPFVKKSDGSCDKTSGKCDGN